MSSYLKLSAIDLFVMTLYSVLYTIDARGRHQNGQCGTVGSNGRFIDLLPLARAIPRFEVHLEGLQFVFNPCIPLQNVVHTSHSDIILVTHIKGHDHNSTVILGTSKSARFTRHRHHQFTCKTSSFNHDSFQNQPIKNCSLDSVLTAHVINRPSRTVHNDQMKSPGDLIELVDESVEEEDEDGSGSSSLSSDELEVSSDELEGSSDDSEEGEDSKSEDEYDHSYDRTTPSSNDLNKQAEMMFPHNVTAALKIRSKGSCEGYTSFILYQCNPHLVEPPTSVFKLIYSSCNTLYFVLSHRCCCEGLCDRSKFYQYDGIMPPNHILAPQDPIQSAITNASFFHDAVTEIPEKSKYPNFFWLILVVNFGVLVTAIFIGGVCCRKGSISTAHGPYNFLPALHSSRLTVHSSVESFYQQRVPHTPHKSAMYLDYTLRRTASNKLPQLTNCVIASGDLDIGQRLGGGQFGDTYLAEWKDRAVAAKRLTVGVHQGQLQDEDHKWITNEITNISHQRHKSLVAVFGVCLETRQPYVITEYIEGESLKDQLIKRNDEGFNWSRKIKICMNVADGIAFLHSAKRAVIHRDLRSANILIDIHDMAKVVDFGMTKLIQRLREGCSGRKGCYCQKELCALPATIRWTAPELLRHPCAKERDDYNDNDIITPECDTYSFGMVLWEIASHCDPFEDIPDENEVMELVQAGVRPRTEILYGMLPHLRELMVTCWDANKDKRPLFKQIAVHLKNCLQILTKMSHKPRTRTNSNQSKTTGNTATHQLKSVLNIVDL